MKKPAMILTNEALHEYRASLIARNIEAIALDMEADQGNIRYKYSISIIQINDGEDTFIVDALALGQGSAIKDLLTDARIKKIMFSCGNDLFLTQNVLGCTIFPIRDIACAQKILGQKNDLTQYLGIDKAEKDAFQRANWLKRPISPEMLKYAANDVAKLLTIERDLARLLIENGFYAKYIEECERLSTLEYKIDQIHSYLTKFPGYSRLNNNRKKMARAVWIFRELLGEKFDCPVGYLMSKSSMIAVTKSRDAVAAIACELNKNRRDNKKLSTALIEKLYERAVKMSEEKNNPADRRTIKPDTN